MFMRVLALCSFIPFALSGPAAAATQGGEVSVVLKIAFVQDAHANWKPGTLERFWREIWPEAARDLGRAGIRVTTTWKLGEIRQSASGNLHFSNLDRGALNIVLVSYL